MRLSLLIDTHNKPLLSTVGEALALAQEPAEPGERLVRLPRRLVKYLQGTTEDPRHLWYHGRLLLEEWASIHKALDLADEFLRGARRFRIRFRGPWRVGDPCYVNGEGHGNLFFVQALEPSCLIVNGCRENRRKVYRPSYPDLFRELLRERHNLQLARGRAEIRNLEDSITQIEALLQP